ncbi:MAG: T9SS type A sorting domain-containing protein [Bacteroidales bacterium]|nr:T9SS type A sorting domain-containing protein [Bacteroidales bacterium]
MKSIFKRGLLLLAFILGLAFHLAAQSTQMTIHFNDGTERSYYMSEYDRVYFEDNETLVVELAPTKSDRFNLADIRKITCAETESVSEVSNASVQLFPNPSHDAFLLRNLNERQTVSIYALDGRIMKSFETTVDQWIDISDLPIGLYLVKTEHQTLKMIKL